MDVQEYRAVCCWERYRRDQGDSLGVRDQEVPRRLDPSRQVPRPHSLGWVGPINRQRGAIHPPIMLHRQSRLAVLLQVRQQRGAEAGAALVRLLCGDRRRFRGADWGGPLLPRGGRSVLSAQDHVARPLLRDVCRDDPPEAESAADREAGDVRDHLPPPMEALRTRGVRLHRSSGRTRGRIHHQAQRPLVEIPQGDRSQEVPHH
mmetsp:Transcript_12428/g.30105  ORF Transcript_12428/g.30105 Transcript_12428/m.30105 type:complete len:204 (-) Transcript_12428:1188-1799(-)